MRCEVFRKRNTPSDWSKVIIHLRVPLLGVTDTRASHISPHM